MSNSPYYSNTFQFMHQNDAEKALLMGGGQNEYDDVNQEEDDIEEEYLWDDHTLS